MRINLISQPQNATEFIKVYRHFTDIHTTRIGTAFPLTFVPAVLHEAAQASHVTRKTKITFSNKHVAFYIANFIIFIRKHLAEKKSLMRCFREYVEFSLNFDQIVKKRERESMCLCVCVCMWKNDVRGEGSVVCGNANMKYPSA